jgi:hypothetical protein
MTCCHAHVGFLKLVLSGVTNNEKLLNSSALMIFFYGLDLVISAPREREGNYYSHVQHLRTA